MGNKIKKVIESEIQELVLGRLSTINARAAKSISKLVRASSKEIAKKFIKVLSKEQKNETPTKTASLKSKAVSVKTKPRSIKTTAASKKSVLTPRKGKK